MQGASTHRLLHPEQDGAAVRDKAGRYGWLSIYMKDSKIIRNSFTGPYRRTPHPHIKLYKNSKKKKKKENQKVKKVLLKFASLLFLNTLKCKCTII